MVVADKLWPGEGVERIDEAVVHVFGVSLFFRGATCNLLQSRWGAGEVNELTVFRGEWRVAVSTVLGI